MSDIVVLSVDPGTTFTVSVVYNDANGAPVDLTGYTYQWFVDVVGLNTYTDPPEVTPDVDLTTGRVTLSLSPAQTALFTLIRGFHRLRVTSPGGVVTDIVEGAIDVCS